MSRVLGPRQVWGLPAALGVLSLVGLVAALVADGVGDALSWLALAVPAVVCVRGLWRPAAVPPRPPGPPGEARERRAARPASLRSH